MTIARWRKIHVAALLSLLLLLAAPPQAQAADDVIFAFFTRGWMPMEMMVARQPAGIAVDIFRAVMPDNVNAMVEPHTRPRKFLYSQTKPVYTRLTAKEWLSTEHEYLFSDPVMSMTNVMLSPVGRPLDYYSPDSLEGKTLGCIKNYTYPKVELMIAAGKTKRYDVNTVPVLLRMVKEGRVDAAVVDVGEARWIIRNTPDLKPEDFFVAPRPVDEVQLRFVFNRAPGWEERLPEINARIRAFRQSGELEQILSRYR